MRKRKHLLAHSKKNGTFSTPSKEGKGRGQDGQDYIAQGKASGRTPLALPWENIPSHFPVSVEAVRCGGRADSTETRKTAGRLKVRR
jgi:hypothetical protein